MMTHQQISQKESPAMICSLLPPDKMPTCWHEDERMNALFSPFRSKSVNPQDWSSKYKFWHNMIHEFLRYRLQCNFSVAELNDVFKRKGCAPLCLATVTEELLRNNEIILEDDFLKEQPESWAEWSVDMLIKRPLSWSVTKVKNYVVGQDVVNVKANYIYIPVVKELADIILSAHEIQRENTLTTIPEILKYSQDRAANPYITETSIKLALVWLRHMKKATFKKDSELLIKISSSGADKITEAEENLYRLLKQEAQLVQDIESMEEEKLKIVSEVKAYLTRNSQLLAKTHLRKKKELEKTIEKRAHVLENIRILISNIQDAHSNLTVLNAYKAGSNALKQISQNGLAEGHVRDVIDDLSETLEDHSIVQSTLSEPLHDAGSDSDLEKELAELLQADKEKPTVVKNEEPADILKDLEQRLTNLRVQDLPSLSKPAVKSTSTASQVKEQLLAQSNCI